MLTLARTHPVRFAALQGFRPDDRSGAPWPLAMRGVNAAAMAGILLGAPESPAETPAAGRGLKLARGA